MAYYLSLEKYWESWKNGIVAPTSWLTYRDPGKETGNGAVSWLWTCYNIVQIALKPGKICRVKKSLIWNTVTTNKPWMYKLFSTKFRWILKEFLNWKIQFLRIFLNSCRYYWTRKFCPSFWVNWQNTKQQESAVGMNKYLCARERCK